jgi:alpha-beta hydrolase superfamily lysophospholipase
MSTTEPRARDVVIRSQDGLTLHARHWPAAESRGSVVVAHGFGEHGGSYDHVARALAGEAGVDVVAPDLRGHGRSPGRRGVVGRYDELTADLLAAFDWAARTRPGLPRYLLGHSNGGQVALRAALDTAAGPRIDGLILSNPTLRLAAQVPAYKLMLGRLLHRYAPGVTLRAPLDAAKLTRDPVMQRRRHDDPLGHSRISAPLFFGMVEGGRDMTGRAGEIRQPLLMILGGADPIVDPEASRDVFDRIASADKTLLLFPHMLHEPFNELGREKVIADLISWLEPRLYISVNGTQRPS